MKTLEEIQKEFESLTSGFEAKKLTIENDESLHTLMATHPLYEIEPYFNEHNNEFIDENSPSSLIMTDEDYNPDTDQLYRFKMHMENRKAYFRTEIFGGGVSYDTLYSYTTEYYSSATIYVNPEMQKAIKLAYLFFKKGVPHLYIECTEHGAITKTYFSEDDRLLGYLQEYAGHDHKYEVTFAYNYEGALESIKGKLVGQERETLIFKRPDKEENIENTLEKIENLLVEEIADQILANVKIPEQVYCILLEYTMQGHFHLQWV